MWWPGRYDERLNVLIQDDMRCMAPTWQHQHASHTLGGGGQLQGFCHVGGRHHHHDVFCGRHSTLGRRAYKVLCLSHDHSQNLLDRQGAPRAHPAGPLM